MPDRLLEHTRRHQSTMEQAHAEAAAQDDLRILFRAMDAQATQRAIRLGERAEAILKRKVANASAVTRWLPQRRLERNRERLEILRSGTIPNGRWLHDVIADMRNEIGDKQARRWAKEG